MKHNPIHLQNTQFLSLSVLCMLALYGCPEDDPQMIYITPMAGMTAGTTPPTAGMMAGTTYPVGGQYPPGECPDRDRDGFQDRACNADVTRGGGDCDDTSNAINPGRVENCANAIDNNCNGLLPAQDPMCQQACPDMDRDGFQDAMCNSDPNQRGGDCDDTNYRVYPGAMEICGNQLDDDCTNGDLACLPNCTDADRDGFGVGSDCRGPDCDDRNPRINPFQSEICGDGIDQDCNGSDLICPMNCEDRDRDGFGIGPGCRGMDCDDTNPNVNPSVIEIINDNIDNDCNGSDLTTRMLCDDPDLDGYGVGTGCLGFDCDQADPRVNSGRIEICGNGLDDDCNRGDQVCTTVGVGTCVDNDGDGHGQGACRNSGLDCDDNNPLINPFEEEVCNGVDDNCNNVVDECSGRNQVCDSNYRCVGQVGAPCAQDQDCLQEQGLVCDQRSRECRVSVGDSCLDSSECVGTAECTSLPVCRDGLTCYQLEGAHCDASCDCTGTLLCNDLNSICVECAGGANCDADEVCSDGGFCMDERYIGDFGDNAVIEMLEIILDCHQTYRGAPSTRGCSRVQVGRDLGSMNGQMLDAVPSEENVIDYVCENNGEVENYFSADDYRILQGIVGCGLIDLQQLWWPNRVQVGSEVCVYYAAQKSGFGFPQSTRSEVIVVDLCTISVID